MTSEPSRSQLWQDLKGLGFKPAKRYRDYTTTELAEAFKELKAPESVPDFLAEGFEDLATTKDTEVRATTPTRQDVHDRRPRLKSDKESHALREDPRGVTEDEEPLRVDDEGRTWYREEINPHVSRGKRLRKRITFTGPETVEVRKVQNGDYIETIEVIGEATRSQDAFVTMPPSQTGIFKDARFPFKIFTYNGSLGFSFGDVNDFYGGEEFVPPAIKKKFVGNMLAYDIKTVIAEIERKAREIKLARTMR